MLGGYPLVLGTPMREGKTAVGSGAVPCHSVVVQVEWGQSRFGRDTEEEQRELEAREQQRQERELELTRGRRLS
jgi:hypothetical protein